MQTNNNPALPPSPITQQQLRDALQQRAREQAAKQAALPPVPPCSLTPAALLEALKRRP